MVGRTPQQGSALREVQPQEARDFMLVSHLLIGAFLGYLGGKLTVVIRRRSEAAETARHL
jgi:hypothetical protein